MSKIINLLVSPEEKNQRVDVFINKKKLYLAEQELKI